LPFGALLQPPYFERWDLAAGPDSAPFLLDHGWGVAALLLAPAGLTARGPLRAFGIALVVTGLVLSMGRYFAPSEALSALPPFSFFRFPERYDALSVLGGACLAAAGSAALSGQAEKRRVAWGVTWAVLAIVLFISSSLATADTTVGALQRSALWLAVAALAAVVLKRHPVLLAAAVALLCLWDWSIARDGSRLVLPRAAWADVSAPPVEVAAAGARVWRENARVVMKPLVRGEADFAAELAYLHATFASATPGEWGIDELGGYSPVSLHRWQQVIRTFAEEPDVLFRLFNVCWVVSTPDRVWTSRFEVVPAARLAANAELFAYRGCLPRAWAVASAHPVNDLPGALERMKQAGFDPAREAVSENAPAERAFDVPTVQVSPRRSPREIELTVSPAARDAFVVVSETAAPGWRVTVDGVDAPIELVDGTLLGVVVPAGKSRVAFRYSEPLLGIGATITGLALLLVVFLGWRLRGEQATRGGVGRVEPKGGLPL
jgi:hypothetical protein